MDLKFVDQSVAEFCGGQIAPTESWGNMAFVIKKIRTEIPHPHGAPRYHDGAVEDGIRIKLGG